MPMTRQTGTVTAAVITAAMMAMISTVKKTLRRRPRLASSSSSSSPSIGFNPDVSTGDSGPMAGGHFGIVPEALDVLGSEAVLDTNELLGAKSAIFRVLT